MPRTAIPAKKSNSLEKGKSPYMKPHLWPLLILTD